MQILILGLIAYVAAVLEFSGVGADPRGIEPRWLLLAAAHFAWTQRPGPGIVAAGVCGLCQAVADGRELGLSVAVVAVAVAIVGWVRRTRRWSSGVAYLISVFACTAACVLTLDFVALWLNGATHPEPHRRLLAAGAQGVMSALWGGGLWCVSRVLAAARRTLLPPLDWRPTRS